jgi:hypothetical protein
MPARPDGKTIEFEGFVDKFDKDVAHVTLKTQSGGIIHAKFPVDALTAQGVYERRRFRCWFARVDSAIGLVVEPIPGREISEDRERQLDDWLRKSLGDDDAPQNDY